MNINMVLSQKKLVTKNTIAVSMVSLIISMALSVVIIAAVMQVFNVVRQKYSLIQNINELNNTIAYTVNRMTTMIGYAGHKVDPAASFRIDLGSDWYQTYLLPLYVSTAAEGQKEQIIVGYYGDSLTNANDDDFFTNCLGVVVAPDSLTRTKFSVVPVSGRSGLSLRCDNLDAAGNSIASSYLISDLVEGMWVSYAYDNSDLSRFYYRKVSFYPQGVTGQKYRSLRVALLLHTRNEVFPKAKTQVFNILQRYEIRRMTMTSKYLYKLYEFTILLYNTERQ